jgi:hypothetical protein
MNLIAGLVANPATPPKYHLGILNNYNVSHNHLLQVVRQEIHYSFGMPIWVCSLWRSKNNNTSGQAKNIFFLGRKRWGAMKLDKTNYVLVLKDVEVGGH